MAGIYLGTCPQKHAKSQKFRKSSGALYLGQFQLTIYEISFATRKIHISAKIVVFDLMRLVRFVWHIHKFFPFFPVNISPTLRMLPVDGKTQ